MTQMQTKKQKEMSVLLDAFVLKHSATITNHNDVTAEYIEMLIERNHDWGVKRNGGHRWEVRTGVKDTVYYGETLKEAFLRALLEIP